MATLPVVALEIGTAKVCTLVGEVREDGNILITGIGQTPSFGVRKGQVVNLEKVVECVRIAIQGAEEIGQVDIREVNLVVAGGDIQSLVNPGCVPVFDASLGVTQDDISEVMQIARTVNLPPDREILHSIAQKYSVDFQTGILNPEKMQGSRLSLDMLIMHGSRSLLGHFVNAVHNLGLDVTDIAYAGLCAALATLTPEQKECGALLLDLGAGTTSYIVYADEVIADAGVLAVGGDHITNDIAQGFNLPLKRAENLKHNSGTAILEENASFQRITIPAEVGFSACSVSAMDLYMIIYARVEEIFMLVQQNLEKKGLLRQLGAGVILTGGGAKLKGITDAAERVFDMPCAIGRPKNFSGMSNAYEGAEYAAPLGMIRYALKNARQAPDGGIWKGMFKKIMGR
ncbi:MAG: cell division protein FtsA [Kiritimatiellia bacterium]|nr:cell division protein FtsA [Lentisphaerota bacterium]